MSSPRDRRTPCATAVAHAFIGDAGGATAIEYGLIVALISIGIVAAMGAAGREVVWLFDSVAAAFPKN